MFLFSPASSLLPHLYNLGTVPLPFRARGTLPAWSPSILVASCCSALDGSVGIWASFGRKNFVKGHGF